MMLMPMLALLMECVYTVEKDILTSTDLESMEKKSATCYKMATETGGILFITEGVFGMRGQQGKLKEIVALKKKYNFRLLVDDAHGFGTLGKTGAGAGEEQDCQDGIDVYFSTLQSG
jgi:glycine C-acetyltransferase